MATGTILVTGGTRGIGRAVVESLLADGAGVAFTYHTDEKGARALESATDGRARGYAFDLKDQAAPGDLVRRVEEEAGPVEGLVNNAGVRAEALLAMTPDAVWSDVVETNLAGLFRCCRAVVPGMVHRRRGAIVNVASLSALHGVAGQSAYAASKAGIVGLTRSLAREVGRRGVRVNAVAPGFVRTDMTSALTEEQVERLRAPECLPAGVDAACVAETVRFLLSPRASSITGQCWVIDAGASA